MAVEPTLTEIKAYAQLTDDALDNLINTHLTYAITNLKSQIGSVAYDALNGPSTPSTDMKVTLANEALICLTLEKVIPHSNQYAFSEQADYQSSFRNSQQMGASDLELRISQYISIAARNIEVILKEDATEAEPETACLMMGGVIEEEEE